MGHHHDHDHKHNHKHDHSHHGHHHAPTQFNFAFILAIVLNGLFVIAEAFYAYQANSMSLLADAGHNLGDVLGLIMAWVAMLLLAKKATEKYSYGFKRTTILAAIGNAACLIAATLIIIYESVSKLLHPQPVHEIQIMIVAAIGIFVNGGTALLFVKGQDDLNIKAAFLHLMYDALISIGVVVTGAIVLWTHLTIFDPLVGLAIAATIFYGSWGLLRNSLDLILDAVPYNVNRDQVQAYFDNLPPVREVHHLHIWSLSTKEVALTAHLVAPDGLSDQQLHQIHDDLAQQFKIAHATIQVERGESRDNGCVNVCEHKS